MHDEGGAGMKSVERMNGDFAQGTITFTADLPQEAIDKVLGNTKEDMDKWLDSGNTFDLSDGADRTVVYISFPKHTKPEDIVRVVRCRECKYWNRFTRVTFKDERKGLCEYRDHIMATRDDFYCADGERRTDEQ